MPEQRSGKIADVFSDLLVLGTYLKDTKDIGSPDHLRTRLHHLFHQADETAKTRGVPSDAQTHARYAVAAYLDEMIINSRWATVNSGRPGRFNMTSSGSMWRVKASLSVWTASGGRFRWIRTCWKCMSCA